ncbi:MAG: prepilin-type N-terminal cleavage/methylation domain-containing protein [Proteobacteria bacterium]|nr:prepilin-type N-terminal cleavage/methylation domain-containing protein [Pseudomonadota bacterium]NCA28663.1 prepilin-type N-terminal cleavage/methylation domain-containing protein [Pseudomonadota bacterium]
MTKFHKIKLSNLKKAFSLVEISIVVLIIGLLIVGVSKGIDMVYEARVATARGFTMNAPMKSIEGLELWLETTSQSSLSKDSSSVSSLSNPEDNQPIGMWNDIKNQGTIKYNAIQSNSSYRPVFKKDGINKLPALYFDGVDDFIAYSLVDGETRVYALNNFVIFAVVFPLSSCVNTSGATGATSGQKYAIYPQYGLVYSNMGSMAGAGISVCTNYINAVEHSGYYMPLMITYSNTINKPVQITLKYDKIGSSLTSTLYVNSSSQLTGSSTYNVFPSFNFGGGNWGYFKGYIGEVIIYSNELKDSDRNLIEKYLMDKWRINN